MLPLFLTEIDPLKLYSSISLLISLLFFSLGCILFLCKKYILKSTLLQNIVKNKQINLIFLFSLIVKDVVLDLNPKAYQIFLISIHGIMLLFLIVRFGIVSGNPFILSLPHWSFTILVFLSLFCVLLRNIVKFGYVLETASEINVPMYYSWSETFQAIKTSSARLSKLWLPGRNLQNHGPNAEKMTLYTTSIAAVGVAFGGGVLWQAIKANEIAERNVEIAERNVEIAERNLEVTEVNWDRQAVKDGFMTRETYDKKWNENGNRKS